jgi:hypothetical protein
MRYYYYYYYCYNNYYYTLFVRHVVIDNFCRIIVQIHVCYVYRHIYVTSTVRSEIRCALRLRYVDLVVSIEVAVEVFCCFTVFSC